MFRAIHSFLLLVALTSAVWLSGCDSSVESDQPTPTSTSSGGHDHGDPDHGDHAHGDVEDGSVAEQFAKLSAEDRTLAMRQKTCPVTDEPLGSMGSPIKVRVKDHDVFICCEACRDELLENADQYLTKLNL